MIFVLIQTICISQESIEAFSNYESIFAEAAQLFA